jgi:hypothetical protein
MRPSWLMAWIDVRFAGLVARPTLTPSQLHYPMTTCRDQGYCSTSRISEFPAAQLIGDRHGHPQYLVSQAKQIRCPGLPVLETLQFGQGSVTFAAAGGVGALTSFDTGGVGALTSFDTGGVEPC